MTAEKIHLTKEKETMLMRFHGRVIQSQWKNPILRDPWAEEAMRHIDHDMSKTLLGIIARRFPVFLVPEASINLEEIRDCDIEIHWYDTTWYMQLPNHQRFFFNLPTTLLEQYLAEGNILSELRAFDLKADYLSKVQVMVE